MIDNSSLIQKIENYTLIAGAMLACLLFGERIYTDYKNKTNKSPTSIEQKVIEEKPRIQLENKVVSPSEDKIDNYLKALNAIESGGNTNASRYESHLNDASYGLHQILTNTARELENKCPELPRLGEDVPKSLCDPNINTQYAKAFLKELDQLYEGDPKLVAVAYNSGTRRPLIARVQQQLNDILSLNVECDGVIGDNTKTILKSFQKQYGLKADGILGPETYNVIQELWIQKNPNKPNSKGIVPNKGNIKDYAERFSNLVESYSR